MKYNQLKYSKIPFYKEQTKKVSSNYIGLLPPFSSIYDTFDRNSHISWDFEKPGNEGHLHYNMKQTIQNHLTDNSTFSVVKTCSTTQNPQFISPSFWTCNNMTEIKNWISGWNKCEMEYRFKGASTYIFDIALINENENKKEVVGVVEVFYKSAMTKSKVNHLNKIKLPWIEMCTNQNLDDILYHNKFHVFSSSDGPWTCDHCLKAKGEYLKSIGSIIDIYPNKKLGWVDNGRFCRLIYGIYENQELDESGNRTYFLVEASYDIDASGMMHVMYKRQSSLIHSVSKESNNLMLDELKQHLDLTIKKYSHHDPHMIVDVRVLWPGLSLREMFGNDKFSNIVDFENMKSLQSLFPSIARIFGYNYKWDISNMRWTRTRNYSAIR